MSNTTKTAIALFLNLILWFHAESNSGIEAGRSDSLLIVDSISNLKAEARNLISVGDYNTSLELLERVQNLSVALFGEKSLEVATNYVNLSTLYYYKWEYDSALIFLSKAEEIYIADSMTPKEYLGFLYSNFGLIYYSLTDYAQARIYYSNALTYLDNASQIPYNIWYFTLNNRLGLLEISEHHFTKAIDYFNKSIEIANTMEINSARLVTIYLNLAIPYTELKQIDKSIDIQHKAIELCRIDSAQNAYRLGMLYNNIGLDYLELNQLQLAEEYLNKSLAITNVLENRTSYLADIYENFGKLYEKRGQYLIALEYYQQGIINLADQFSTADPFSNPSQHQINNKSTALKILKSKTSCLYQIFKIQSKFEYLDAAIQTSQISIGLIEELKNSYLTRESKLQLAEHEDETYKTGLDLCFLAYQQTSDEKYCRQAFSIAEKTKSSVLLSSLREMEAMDFGGIPEELLNRERVLSKRIAFYKENIYEENQYNNPDTLKIKKWESYLFKEQREHNELIQLFEKKYPDYFSLKYNTAIVEPEVLQKILRKRSVMEFALTDTSLFIFLIEKGKFKANRQKIDHSFFKLVHDYLALYQEFDFSKQSYSSFIEYCWKSKELYNYLIRPFEDEISEDNLLIVPEGILSYIPFETLIREVPNEIPNDYYRNLHYLLFDYAISYSYSSTLFRQVYSSSPKFGKKKLGAFAPEYEASTEMLQKVDPEYTTRQKYRQNLYPIPGVIDEIHAISQIVSSDIYIGKEATENVFRRVAGKYDLLHLAMHTVVDNEDPMFSKLIFTEVQDTIYDGLLNTFEIFSLRLRARMVVLSACATGEGNYSNGEGVMSLARGFVYAGSPSLIMTLWEVEDKSSINLMEAFYKNLFAGKTKAEALQKAKIKYIQEARPENTHPFFWSSYVILGNTQAIARKAWTTLLLVLVFTGVLGIAGVFIYKRLHRTS